MGDRRCSEPGCERIHFARGFCQRHYNWWYKHGGRGAPRVELPSIEERFWLKVDKDGPTIYPHLGPCWMWTGAKAGGGWGYGYFTAAEARAHRYAYELLVGPIPPDRPDVLHRCDNPACVRADPDPLVSHLFVGTNADNQADKNAKGRGRPNGVLTPLLPCGTVAAYRRHLYRGEPVCDACRLAHNADCLARYHARRRKATR